MNKAILVIDDIPENLFTENLSIKYQLIYYPDGHMKELGIHGKQLLKPMPKERLPFDEKDQYALGFNAFREEILGTKDND